MPRVPSHAASWQASRRKDVPSSAWSMSATATATALAAPHADAPHQKGGTKGKGSSPRSSTHKSALNVNHSAARLDAALAAAAAAAAAADFEQVTRTPFMGEMFSDSSYDGFSDMLGQPFLQNAGSTAQQLSPQQQQQQQQQQQLSHSGSSKDFATSSSANQQDAHRASDTAPAPGSGDAWTFGVTNMHSSARTTPSHSRQASQDGTEDGEVAKGGSNTSTNARQSACPFCDRVFKRSDLALRHITRVHSSSTAHKCKHCDVGFSRSDVLKRHMTTCRKGPGGKSLKPMKKACESCASLKIVCDRQDPSCASCRDRNIQCIYKPSAKLVRTKSPVRALSDEEIPMAKEGCATHHTSDGHFEDQHSSSSRQQHAPPSLQSPETSQPQPVGPVVSHPPAAVSRSVHQSGMPAYDSALVMPSFADAAGASVWSGPEQNIPMDVNGVPATAALTMDLGQNVHSQDQAMQDWSRELHAPAAFAYATSGASVPPLLAPQQVAADASLSMPMMDIIHSTGLTPYDVGIDAKMNQNSQIAPVASTSGSISGYPRTADVEQGQEQALHLSDVLLGNAPASSLASETDTRGHDDGGSTNFPFSGLAPSIEGVTGGSEEASLLGFLHHDDFFARVQSPLSDLLVAGTPSFLPPGADTSRLTQPEHHIWPVMPSASANLSQALLDFEVQALACGLTSPALKLSVNNFFGRFISQYPLVHLATFDFANCPGEFAQCALIVGLRFDESDAAQRFSTKMLMTSGERITSAFLESETRQDSYVALLIAGLLALKFSCFSSTNAKLQLTSRLLTGNLMSLLQVTNFGAAAWPHDQHSPELWHAWALNEWKKRLVLLTSVEDAAQMIFFGHSFGMQRSMIESMRMPYASEIWNKPDAHSWAESMRTLADAPPTLPQALSTLASPKAALRPGLATPFSMWILIHIQVNSACNALRLAQSAVKAHAAATAKNATQVHEMQRQGSTASSDASALGTSASSASTPWYPSKTTSGRPTTVTGNMDQLSPSTQQALLVKLEQLVISLERWRVHWVEGERAGFDSEAYRMAPQRFIFDAVPFVALCTAFMRRTMRVLNSGGNTEGLRPRLNELDNWVALTTCSNPTEHSNESAHDMNIDGGEACTTPDVEENPDESWASKYLQSLRASRAERKGKLLARSTSAPASDSTDASASASASAASRRPSIHPLWLIEDLAIAEPARHDSG